MRAWFAPAILFATLAVGCRPTVDVSQALQVLEPSTGWFDVGIIEGGQNKLVPSISFKLKNVSNQTLPVLQVNALFRQVNQPEEWGSAFLTVTGSEGLAPGATTDKLVAKSQQGYTGTEPRTDMLRNRLFVDAKLELFAKYASVQWKKIGEFAVARQLVTP